LTPQVSVVSGRVNALTATGFKLPGVTVSISNSTTFTGGVAADLSNGIEVLVSGLWNSQLGALVATSIEVHMPQVTPGSGSGSTGGGSTSGTGSSSTGSTGGSTSGNTGSGTSSSGNTTGASQTPAVLNLRGAITEYVSRSAFRIAGQKVDASLATITGGSVLDLGNARTVEATGVIAGVEGARYLKLSTLRIIQ
jgi:hypothetical protein